MKINNFSQIISRKKFLTIILSTLGFFVLAQIPGSKQMSGMPEKGSYNSSVYGGVSKKNI